ncbi:hypothetical protein Tcan_07622 [Toxocara canis]|uniref:Uncharacterized protein n=1 Tax=Toxocara canis TaxID=6265 RepID=A0A0B2V202_TOXCA|nr:hypothetical protein Tcan_07622 [Toxocara canis]
MHLYILAREYAKITTVASVASVSREKCEEINVNDLRRPSVRSSMNEAEVMDTRSEPSKSLSFSQARLSRPPQYEGLLRQFGNYRSANGVPYSSTAHESTKSFDDLNLQRDACHID